MNWASLEFKIVFQVRPSKKKEYDFSDKGVVFKQYQNSYNLVIEKSSSPVRK